MLSEEVLIIEAKSTDQSIEGSNAEVGEKDSTNIAQALEESSDYKVLQIDASEDEDVPHNFISPISFW